MPLAASAQTLVTNPLSTPVAIAAPAATMKFGYVSYDKVMKSMSDYIIAQHNISDLQSQYDEEAKRTENDFNNKYEAFLEDQDRLAESIRNKRQSELLDMLNKNAEFKRQAEKLISDTRKSTFDAMYKKIDAAVKAVAAKRGLMFVVNSDNHNLPFVNPKYGEDLTTAVESELKKVN